MKVLARALVCTLVANAAMLNIAGAADAARPSERIYVSVFAMQDAKFVREIIAVDPATGKSETIVADGHHPRVSPDGRSISYWSFVGQEGCDVWVRPLEAEAEPVRVWSGEKSVTQTWTRDGKSLLVSRGHRPDGANEWQYATWRVDPQTSEAAELTLPASEHLIDRSPVGEEVLTSNNRNQLYTMLVDGSQPRKAATSAGRVFHGRLSPDGKSVAFVQHTPVGDQAVTVDLDGKNRKVALAEKELTVPHEVAWAPDGKRLAVVAFDWILEGGRKLLKADGDNRFRIVIMDRDGANQRELALDRAVLEIGEPDWR